MKFCLIRTKDQFKTEWANINRFFDINTGWDSGVGYKQITYKIPQYETLAEILYDDKINNLKYKLRIFSLYTLLWIRDRKYIITKEFVAYDHQKDIWYTLNTYLDRECTLNISHNETYFHKYNNLGILNIRDFTNYYFFNVKDMKKIFLEKGFKQNGGNMDIFNKKKLIW